VSANPGGPAGADYQEGVGGIEETTSVPMSGEEMTIRLRSVWSQARQAEVFASLVGGKVLEKGVPYRGALIEVPETFSRTFRNRYGEQIVQDYPTVLDTVGGKLVNLAADVCNGELFLVPGRSPFDSYPCGRPVALQAYLEDLLVSTFQFLFEQMLNDINAGKNDVVLFLADLLDEGNDPRALAVRRVVSQWTPGIIPVLRDASLSRTWGYLCVNLGLPLGVSAIHLGRPGDREEFLELRWRPWYLSENHDLDEARIALAQRLQLELALQG
jgi:hypothetical protein